MDSKLRLLARLDAAGGKLPFAELSRPEREARRALKKDGAVSAGLDIVCITAIGRDMLAAHASAVADVAKADRRWRITTAISVIALVLSAIAIAVAIWTALRQSPPA